MFKSDLKFPRSYESQLSTDSLIYVIFIDLIVRDSNHTDTDFFYLLYQYLYHYQPISERNHYI